MSQFACENLLATDIVTASDVLCRGGCRHRSPQECTATTRLVYPYRGVFVRHVGCSDSVAEANQVLFFNAGEAYSISHPVDGGDACLSIGFAPEILTELAPKQELRGGPVIAFRRQRRRIDARAQAMMAMVRHSLSRGAADTLEGETLVLTLVRRSLGERTSYAATASAGRQKLADRAKLVLSSDLARRWTLAEIAREVRVSPVYLTQVFQQVEGMPLYRYQMRLRLARALNLLGEYDDLTTLGMDLGFSSHSHFTASFRQAYGRTPAEFQRSVRLR